VRKKKTQQDYRKKKKNNFKNDVFGKKEGAKRGVGNVG